MPTVPALPSIHRLQISNILLGIMGLVAYGVSMFTSGPVSVIITAIGVVGFLISSGVLVRRSQHVWPRVKTIGLSLLTAIAGSYLILALIIVLGQDLIADQTSSFFQPKALAPETVAKLAAGVETLELTTPDGAHLRGWLVRNSDEPRTPLLIYFEGSGSDVAKMIPYVHTLDGWSVALINYRGFGQSTGTPSQANSFADATFIYDTLTQRSDIDAQRVATMGYSLGTGVAVHLSEQRPTRGTVLAAPYDSQTIIGLKRPPFYLPLMGLMRPYFDSISRAPRIKTPLLTLIGATDPVVPPDLSHKLVSQWGGAVEVKTYTGEDHDLLLHANSSWVDISAFLQTIGQK